MRIRFFILFLFNTCFAFAQTKQVILSDTAGRKVINILYADYLEFVDTLKDNPIRKLVGNVQLEHNGSTFYCDSTNIYIKQNKLKAFGKINIKHKDGTNIYSDYLNYDGNTKQAELMNNVSLTKEGSTLKTQYLTYNTQTKIATYNKGGILTKENTTIASKQGEYNSNTDDAEFIGNVNITHPDYTIQSERLRYNTANDSATFVAPTHITRGKSKVYCEEGWYKTKTEQGFFKKNAFVIDPPNTLKGDEIYYSARTKQGKVKGAVNIVDSIKQTQLTTKNLDYDAQTKTYTAQDSVLYIDKKKNIEAHGDRMVFNDSTKFMHISGNGMIDARNDKIKVWGNTIFYNDSMKTFLSYNKTILATEIDADTLWLTADTLHYKGNPKANKSDTVTLNGNFKAHRNVKLYKSDFQGFADSMCFKQADSTFQFFGNPIFWNEQNQFTADTTYIVLKNKKLNRVDLRQNAFIISRVDSSDFYNQIKGRLCNVYFIDNKINNMYVYGNSETMYFAQDDAKAFIGVNKAVCARMRISFKGKNEVDKIRFIDRPEADFIPIKQAMQGELTLPNFKWQIARKPLNKWMIFPK